MSDISLSFQYTKRCFGCGEHYRSPESSYGVQTYCGTCTGNGQEGFQAELPADFVKQFTLPTIWGRKLGNVLEPGYVIVRLPDYFANGSKATKYKPVHWHDWMKSQTKPWKRPADAPMKTKPGPDTYQLEIIK